MAAIGLLQQRTAREPEMLADQLQTALNTRILIEQAKGILAEHSEMAAGDTFYLLRGRARNTGKTLQRVATRLVEGGLRGTDFLPASRLGHSDERD